jgi:stearoyl-CoA desaturase (delta-9 desaturase)
MWAITGLGLSIGYHRLFTHAAFRASRGLEMALAIAGSMAAQSAPIAWVAIHRRHHQFSDRVGDPHSPHLSGPGWGGRLRGLLHAHFTWMARHDFPSPGHYARNLLSNRHLMWVNKRYLIWVFLGLAAPAVFVALVRQEWIGLLTGALWGGAVRMVFTAHVNWMINSITHSFGHRPFQTPDASRNVAAMSWLTFGESFHNNHHAFPRAADVSLGKPWLDPGYLVICLLRRAGLANEICTTSAAMIEARRSAQTPIGGT